MSGTEFFKYSSPRNSNPNPMSISPISFLLNFLTTINTKPMPIAGNDKALIFTLNPKIATIHPVTVVPMLAPIITPMDCVNWSNPAFTKLTTITVVADDDWTIAVIAKPVKIAATRLPVIKLRIDCKRSPAAFWIPSLIVRIPKRKSPKLPTTCKI